MGINLRNGIGDRFQQETKYNREKMLGGMLDWSNKPSLYKEYPERKTIVLPSQKSAGNMYLDKAGVEQWKTNYYKFEGWDPNTGWPTRNTLEELGLRNVADTLDSAGKLGSPG